MGQNYIIMNELINGLIGFIGKYLILSQNLSENQINGGVHVLRLIKAYLDFELFLIAC